MLTHKHTNSHTMIKANKQQLKPCKQTHKHTILLINLQKCKHIITATL